MYYLLEHIDPVAFFKLIRYSYGSGCKTFGCRPYDVRKAFYWGNGRN